MINPLHEQKIIGLDTVASDNFGYSVSISGDYAIAGAFNKSGGGAAYIFTRNGNTWTQQKLIASDTVAGDQFGYSVSISGDYAILGAPYNDDFFGGAGSAYIFVRDGDTWSEQAKLLASDPGNTDEFGTSVAISGNYAIVGAPSNDDGGTSSGSAYIFTRVTDTTWTQQKILAGDRQQGDKFGTSVSISGDYAIIAAFFNDDVGSNSGSAYIFVRDTELDTWSQQQKIVTTDAADSDTFGTSVSISGDYAIVGATGNDDSFTDSGSAYILKRDGTTWSEQAKLVAGDPGQADNFGNSVSISGDYAIVGARNEDTGGTDAAGSAYVFKREGTTWSQITKIFASDKASSTTAQFGISIAIDGGYVIVGANAEDTGVTNAGAAYIYPFEPLLDFDNFNKLAIHGGITPTSTELTDPSGASRSIGTATDIYITDTG